jgi:hypothetical protein
MQLKATEIFRKLASDFRRESSTHWETCWEVHHGCALLRAADMVDSLETFIDQRGNLVYDH